ncbi:uncharacterized protein LOC119167385 [Rhipicephalus microplus]|uniref:uncharacterized protein LOC119167385 n=1 Tax=Rhipicephalus microplus TaxID=6941 RepID=UPI003F6BCFCD
MNTRTFKVVSLLWAAMALCLLVGQTEGIVCSPGVCEQETCEPIDESTCDGIVKPRATFCQCCPACIRLLRIMKAPAWKFIALLSSAAVVSLLVQKVKSISCDVVDSATCQGTVDPNASLCECCPACTKLREKESSQHLPSGGRRNPRA